MAFKVCFSNRNCFNCIYFDQKKFIERGFCDKIILKSADIQLIKRIIPHRYPFLLVDKVIEIDYLKSAVGIKNVTFNEPYFQGHFPGSSNYAWCHYS